MEIKTLGQLIQHLAKKAGMDTADTNLVNVLSNAELSKITLHSDFVKGLDENLLSLTQAKDNHPDIGNVYKAQALNGFDKKMDEIAAEAGLDDAANEELKGIKNSYKRFEVLNTKLKEKIAAENKGKGAEDKSALQKQVDELLEKLRNADSATTAKVAEVESLRKADKIGFELRSALMGIATIYDDLPPKAKQATLDALITNALQDKDAEFDFDEQGAFILRKKDGSNLMESGHSKYTPQKFIDEILAQNKVLKVAQPPKTQNGNESSNNPQRTITANQNGPQGNNQTANINRKLREAAALAGSTS